MVWGGLRLDYAYRPRAGAYHRFEQNGENFFYDDNVNGTKAESRGTSVAELWDLLATTYGSRAPISEAPAGRRPGANLMRLAADNTRARSMLGWTPVTPLENGLRITVESLSLA